jgi:hypothetical protein
MSVEEELKKLTKFAMKDDYVSAMGMFSSNYPEVRIQVLKYVIKRKPKDYLDFVIRCSKEDDEEIQLVALNEFGKRGKRKSFLKIHIEKMIESKYAKVSNKAIEFMQILGKKK